MSGIGPNLSPTQVTKARNACWYGMVSTALLYIVLCASLYLLAVAFGYAR